MGAVTTWHVEMLGRVHRKSLRALSRGANTSARAGCQLVDCLVSGNEKLHVVTDGVSV